MLSVVDSCMKDWVIRTVVSTFPILMCLFSQVVAYHPALLTVNKLKNIRFVKTASPLE